MAGKGRAPQPKLSQTPAAKRARAARRAAEAERDRRNKAARTRYAERRGIAQQRAAEQAAKREAAKARRKIAGKGKKPGKIVDERTLAIGWLEAIRAILAQFFKTSLDLTEAEAGARTPWLIVGRYTFMDPIGYAELGEALAAVADDGDLEAQINPQRLCQIRIVFNDPKSKRGEGASFVSQVGAYEFVLSDMVGEIGSGDDADEDSLAMRYEQTSVESMYFYFSSQLVTYKTVPGWDGKTQTIKL